MGRRVIVLKKRGKSANAVVLRGGVAHYKKAPRSKKDITKLIKKVTNAQQEVKYVGQYIENGVIHNSVINTAADWYRMLPLISQGPDVHERVGNVVSPVRATTHFRLSFQENDTTDPNSRDIYCVLYILKPRFQKAYASTGAAGQLSAFYAAYLDNGQGGDTAFNGTWGTVPFPVNKDGFVVAAKKIFHIYKPCGLQNSNVVFDPARSQVGGVLSSSPAVQHTWTYTCKPGKLRYDNHTQTLPTNYSTMYAIGYYYADGTSPDTGTGVLKVDSWTDLWYRDD